MAGKKWGDVSYNGKTYDLTHLHPFNFNATISGAQVSINVVFGNHCFTDEKGDGVPLPGGRYFCEARYHASLELPRILQERLVNGHVVPHFSKTSNEVYYYSEVNDYAIFFDLRQDPQNPNGLVMFIMSAYEVDQWGKSGLPRGTAVKFNYIGHLRLNGQTYAQVKKQKRR
ncbi:hypothetical protein ACH54D_20645 [Atlantibacter hermannii]|uniref:hypothetical protein n=1 Tax=Atlantibacter hermannii TaxID=565 RepID=UPI00324CA663